MLYVIYIIYLKIIILIFIKLIEYIYIYKENCFQSFIPKHYHLDVS